MTTVVYACDSANVDPSTLVCSNPVWVVQSTFLPPLDATSGITIGIAILTCWAVAYGLKSLRRVGD